MHWVATGRQPLASKTFQPSRNAHFDSRTCPSHRITTPASSCKSPEAQPFPTANGYLRDHCRKLGATRKFSESLTRPSRHQTPMSFKRAARSDLDAPISPLLSPVSRPCSLGCEARYPSPTSYCGAQLEHSSVDTEIVGRKRAQVRRSLLNPNNRTWDGSSC